MKLFKALDFSLIAILCFILNTTLVKAESSTLTIMVKPGLSIEKGYETLVKYTVCRFEAPNFQVSYEPISDPKKIEKTFDHEHPILVKIEIEAKSPGEKVAYALIFPGDEIQISFNMNIWLAKNASYKAMQQKVSFSGKSAEFNSCINHFIQTQELAFEDAWEYDWELDDNIKKNYQGDIKKIAITHYQKILKEKLEYIGKTYPNPSYKEFQVQHYLNDLIRYKLGNHCLYSLQGSAVYSLYDESFHPSLMETFHEIESGIVVNPELDDFFESLPQPFRFNWNIRPTDHSFLDKALINGSYKVNPSWANAYQNWAHLPSKEKGSFSDFRKQLIEKDSSLIYSIHGDIGDNRSRIMEEYKDSLFFVEAKKHISDPYWLYYIIKRELNYVHEENFETQNQHILPSQKHLLWLKGFINHSITNQLCDQLINDSNSQLNDYSTWNFPILNGMRPFDEYPIPKINDENQLRAITNEFKNETVLLVVFPHFRMSNKNLQVLGIIDHLKKTFKEEKLKVIKIIPKPDRRNVESDLIEFYSDLSRIGENTDCYLMDLETPTLKMAFAGYNRMGKFQIIDPDGIRRSPNDGYALFMETEDDMERPLMMDVAVPILEQSTKKNTPNWVPGFTNEAFYINPPASFVQERSLTQFISNVIEGKEMDSEDYLPEFPFPKNGGILQFNETILEMELCRNCNSYSYEMTATCDKDSIQTFKYGKPYKRYSYQSIPKKRKLIIQNEEEKFVYYFRETGHEYVRFESEK